MGMRSFKRRWILFLLPAAAVLLAVSAAFLPGMAWRMDRVSVFLRGVLHPAGVMPAASADEPASSLDSWVFSPLKSTETPRQVQPETVSSVTLPAPEFDLSKDIQDWNNCGPATLALALRMYGWKGDQFTISRVVKPLQTDKNVSLDELAGFVNLHTDGLKAAYRVNGSIALLKQFLAAGYPVIIEESFRLEQGFWPEDDLWAAHYLLVTGYVDSTSSLIVQDSYYGPNRIMKMDVLEQTWVPFNRVMMVIYPPAEEKTVSQVWGEDWNTGTNWTRAMDAARMELQQDPRDAFAWFNLGADLLALRRSDEAAQAFDRAREIGLPQRMLRYQFDPLAAAYETGNAQDLIVLANYALDRTPNSEEALYWKGMAYLLTDQPDAARRSFERALEAHPGYEPASAALGSMGQ